MDIDVEDLVTLLIRKNVITEEEVRDIKVELINKRRQEREDEIRYRF